MYVARFSYDFAPKDRDEAMELIRREVQDARQLSLTARLLVPFTRASACVALQFEIEIQDLNALHDFRNRVSSGDSAKTEWMHRLATILRNPPQVEILHLHSEKLEAVWGED